MRTRTVVWTFVAASGVVAFVLMRSTDFSGLARLIFAWYALAVAFLIFGVVGVTLSTKFKRLDTPEGWLARMFFIWW